MVAATTWRTDRGSNFHTSLQRPQEVDEVLPLLHLQPVEPLDDPICLARLASVCLDSLYQVGRSPVVKQEDALPDTPERGGPELIGAGAALRDPVRQAAPHVMNEEVGEEVHLLVRKSDTRIRRGAAGNHLARGKRRRVAQSAADS